MKHIIQRKYSYIPYPQIMDEPDNPRGKKGTIRSGGCGICSACMIVDQLTTEKFSVRECAQLSFSVGGNHADGTDMTRLGPALAEKFNLAYRETYDVAEAVKALHEGGRVIALVGGIEPDNRGIFTAGGHYIVLIAADEQDEICILDPNWTSKTFPKWEKQGLVRTDGTLVFTTPAVLHQEGKKLGDPTYYIFRRK